MIQRYTCIASPAKVWKDGVGVGGQIDEVKHGAIVTAEKYGAALYITTGANKGKVGWSKLGWFELLPSQPPPSPPPPPPPSSAGRLWEVRGDEELEEFGYKSRTQMPNWKYGRITPSVFRFDKKPTQSPTEYFVDITPQDAALRALNDYNDARISRLYSPSTAVMNRNGFPRLQYLVMSGCVLEEIEIVQNCLKFKTLLPNSDTRGMTILSHPQYVMRWDLVTYRNGETLHVIDRKGEIYWFLTTMEGVGYIPLKWVKPKE